MVARWMIVGVVTVLLAVFCYINFDVIVQTNRMNIATGTPASSPRLLEKVLAEDESSDKVVLALWMSQGIPHRQAAIAYLRDRVLSNPDLINAAQSIGPEAITDPDITVQRDALALMRNLGDSPVWTTMPTMLHDPDPQVRLLWLQYIANHNTPRNAPLVATCIDDPDPQVQTLAVQTLGRWSDQAFSLPEGADEAARTAAINACRTWWSEHRDQYERMPTYATDVHLTSHPSIPFQLTDTRGESVALSNYFGQPVLLYFWVTTDPTCREMVGELKKLRARLGDELAIVSVAVDGVAGGAPDAARYQADDDGTLAFDEQATLAITAAAQAEGVTFPVLIENTGRVAGAFEGFHVPVTVWVDADGQIRRRFTGLRNVATLEAMYQQVAKPLPAMPAPKPTN